MVFRLLFIKWRIRYLFLPVESTRIAKSLCQDGALGKSLHFRAWCLDCCLLNGELDTYSCLCKLPILPKALVRVVHWAKAFTSNSLLKYSCLWKVPILPNACVRWCMGRKLAFRAFCLDWCLLNGELDTYFCL